MRVLRAGEHEGWSFVIEPEGSSLAAIDILTSVSGEAVALCLRGSKPGSCWISYAEDGEIVSSFDPLFPDSDYGTRPQTLAQFTGHVQAISNGDRAGAYANACERSSSDCSARCQPPGLSPAPHPWSPAAGCVTAPLKPGARPQRHSGRTSFRRRRRGGSPR
ncbi:DUF6461 domain-containing protein [Streptomyces massasporeus]